MNTKPYRPSVRSLFALAAAGALGLCAAEDVLAVTADNVVCSGCVNTGDIAGGAVTSGKIANDTITGDDVASEALTKNDILDEPGLDFINQNGTGYLSSLSPTYWLYQQQITVTHQAPGFVMCTAQGSMQWYVTGSTPTGYVGWSDTSANNVAPGGYASARTVGASASGQVIPITAMRVFPVVGSGSKTFYLKTKASGGANGAIGYHAQGAACVYFPTQL